MADKEEQSKELRSKIQESIDNAREERRRELFRRRLDVARSGVHYCNLRKWNEAIKAFLTYIQILEDWKQVEKGRLAPSLFDTKSDIAELLLISGVFWDLAKCYDKLTGDQARKEVQAALNKFVLFTRNMPFQTVCMETVRKYISYESPKSKDLFKQAYQQLGGGKCFIASSLIDLIEPETLPTLQKFRDEKLLTTAAGKKTVTAYYYLAPYITEVLDGCPEPIRKQVATKLDRFAQFLRKN